MSRLKQFFEAARGQANPEEQRDCFGIGNYKQLMI